MEALKTVITSIVPMSDEEYNLVQPIISRIEVKKDTDLLQQGEVCRHIYFIETGFFRMFYVDYRGNEINSRFAKPNDFLVDFASFITQKKAQYHCRAMEDSKVIALEYEKVENLYNSCPSWSKFGRLIAESAYLMIIERQEMLHFQTPEERYKTILKKEPYLLQLVSQNQLSSYIGIKPESLSRIRKRMIGK
ncbi:Crp/Fnr family transcriptional regulator [Flavobacterium reichenbachii]|uniref:Crp/Fnr family transcriptional regulator n=1 Tax=Flavobacterium reichenbachii TaxID=362418 RepID=A0A085ZQ83_9FLAO|nr:Crp/Fnr family transcriptional regulator [Flavobacterium reichenbachii]KFF06597.1 Crp/Fnr family transcriptional regulator [Flavobacterium reichenbachii]OXB18797.1 Crp/Fnr family transcriptional regulator [Flavobacterium reichenbachii]